MPLLKYGMKFSMIIKSDKRSLRYAIYEMLTLNPPFCAINVEKL